MHRKWYLTYPAGAELKFGNDIMHIKIFSRYNHGNAHIYIYIYVYIFTHMYSYMIYIYIYMCVFYDSSIM